MRSVRGSSIGWAALKSKNRQTKSKLRCYEQRGEKLSNLGYAGYQAYLASDEWKTIRDEKLKRYPHCILCQCKATQVHHLDYGHRTMLGLRPWRLVQMCGDCHKSIEFDGKRKRAIKEANRVLFETAAKTERGQSWIRWHEEQDKIGQRQFKLAKREQRRKRKK